MPGYDPNRPRPVPDAAPLGLPGDPPAIGNVQGTVSSSPPDPDPPPGPTRRALPREAPPLDRRLPPAALMGALAALLVLMWVLRSLRRR